MTVKYDFYENPVPGKGKKKIRYHARVVSSSTTTTDEMAKDIHSRCTLTESDIKAVLHALGESLEEQLKEGNRVYLEGIGYFQMTLQCPEIRSPKEIRAESIQFKTIAFRPEKKLKNALKSVRFERSPIKNHSNKYSEIELDEKLTNYFQDHHYFIRGDIERICGFTRWMANKRINELVVHGKIIREGLKSSPIYRPAPGYYRQSRNDEEVKER